MINIYLPYINFTNNIRKKETDFCIKKNINNPHIDKVYIFLDDEKDKQDWMINNKVEFIIKPLIPSPNGIKRPLFHDTMIFSNNVENEDINITCNLDIFFDDTLKIIKEKNIDKMLITLTRWNIDINTKKSIFFNNHYSQDVWIWKGKVDLDKIDMKIGTGLPGSDNYICGAFHEAGYKVINPSLEIKTHHLHQDMSRNYNDNDVVRKRLYFLYPNKIGDWETSGIEFWKDMTNFIPSN